jgi:hypothetical protein
MRATRVGSVNERFFNRFERDRKTQCWNWVGTSNAKGYGVISGELLDGTRVSRMLAHRVSWLLHNGPIPESDAAHGTVVMHACDNPRCVNPDHLRLGSQADNVQDMIDKRRRPRRNIPSGVGHWNSAFESQEDIDLICATKGQTKELAEKFGVDVCTIKRIRRRNGVTRPDAEKFVNKPLSQEAIDHIRSTPPGTRGLGKLYGVGKTTIANIRKGLTHAR